MIRGLFFLFLGGVPLKKRVKIFESGKYPQGNFSHERVKKIFNNIKKKSKAIYAHTSKWKEANRKPVEIGEFDKFSVEKKNGKTIAYADLTLSEKGKMYKEDGIFKGISVEIPNDNLTEIALLPIGVNPAVQGAEFEEGSTSFYFEYEEYEIKDQGGKKVGLEEIIAGMKGLSVSDRGRLLSNIIDTTGVGEKKEFSAVIPWDKLEDFKDTKKKSEFEGMTPEEIREKIQAEEAKKNTAKDKAREFMEKNKTKITPGMKEAGLTEEFMQIVQTNPTDYEFEGNKTNVGEVLTNIFEKMPAIVNPGSEFESGLGDGDLDDPNKAAQELMEVI